MEEREPVIKILYENTTRPVNQVWLTFPLSGREKPEQKILSLTRGHEKKSSIPFRIAKVESPIPNLKQYLPADGWFQEISCLAEKIGRMDREEQIKFSGILDCCSISTIEDVLQAADSLSLYDYLPGITCSRELGGYVVENGIMEFPGQCGPIWTTTASGKNTMRPTAVPIQSPALWCGKRKRRRWKKDMSRGSRYSRECIWK